MELSAEQFAEIVNHLNGTPPAEGTVEQRRAARVERETPITIAPVVDGSARTGAVVMVKNLSSRGLAFVRDAQMKSGSQFVVRLARESGPPVELLCTVVHVKEVGTGLWSHGAEFTCLAGAAVGPVAGEADERARIQRSMLR